MILRNVSHVARLRSTAATSSAYECKPGLSSEAQCRQERPGPHALRMHGKSQCQLACRDAPLRLPRAVKTFQDTSFSFLNVTTEKLKERRQVYKFFSGEKTGVPVFAFLCYNHKAEVEQGQFGSVYRGCANLLARAAGRQVSPGAEVPYED